MKAFFEAAFSLQEPAPMGKEGLPYWIFWFLLCVILLLLAFIFLRDKELRRRLSFFFAGPRRKSIQIRLKMMLKKENQKRESLWLTLGQKAWAEDIRVPEDALIWKELEMLEEDRNSQHAEWEKIFSEIQRLNAKLQESVQIHLEKAKKQRNGKTPAEESMKLAGAREKAARKEMDKRKRDASLAELHREKDSLERKIGDFDSRIREIETEAKTEQKETEHEIKVWERRREKVQHRLKEIERSKQGLFLALGKIIDSMRVEAPELGRLYPQIDEINQRISHLEHRLDTLSL